MPGQVTLSDVAREAGVSLATASRALNGSATRTVGEELRVRVVAAAARLHYSPDGIAQAMARGRTTSLGLVVPDIADPRFAAIASGVVAAATAAGLTVALTVSGADPEVEAAHIHRLEHQRAQGVVLVGGTMTDAAAEAPVRAALASFRSVGGGVAVIGRPDLGADVVDAGESSAAADFARALHGLGYRKVALLVGPGVGGARATALAEEFAVLGSPVPAALRLAGKATVGGGYAAVREMIASGADVDLVVAVNDVLALGALAGAGESGVAVPAELAVAGFDGLEAGDEAVPVLTTVRVPYVRIGEEAVGLALSAVGRAGATDRPRTVHVPTEVLLRESTAR
ncbi:MAG TPA: LacI family DNA-binding transcriptional regulator [Cellulomonas sp.]